MESIYTAEENQKENKSYFHRVTPLSKYLALALFVALPFLGGYMGYVFAPEKIIEVERVVIQKTAGDEGERADVNATAVNGVRWTIEEANPDITGPDDYKQYEQVISVDVVFKDGVVERHELGRAYGCDEVSDFESLGVDEVMGRVGCYMSLSGTDFTAFVRDGVFMIERYDDDASGMTDGTTEILLEL